MTHSSLALQDRFSSDWNRNDYGLLTKKDLPILRYMDLSCQDPQLKHNLVLNPTDDYCRYDTESNCRLSQAVVSLSISNAANNPFVPLVIERGHFLPLQTDDQFAIGSAQSEQIPLEMPVRKWIFFDGRKYDKFELTFPVLKHLTTSNLDFVPTCVAACQLGQNVSFAGFDSKKKSVLGKRVFFEGCFAIGVMTQEFAFNIKTSKNSWLFVNYNKFNVFGPSNDALDSFDRHLEQEISQRNLASLSSL
jgi:hypothetical protein